MICKTFLATIALSFLLGSTAAIPVQMAKADDKTLKLPVTFGQTILSTPYFAGLTDKYLIIQNDIQKTYFDVATGEPVDIPDIEENYGRETSNIVRLEGYNADYVGLIQTTTKNHYIYKRAIQYLAFEKGIACTISPLDNDNNSIIIWDINSQKVLWEFKYGHWSELGDLNCIDDLLLMTYNNKTYFYDLMTGKLKLTTRRQQLSRYTKDGDYLLLTDLVVDLSKMTVIKDLYEDTGLLVLDSGKLYQIPTRDYKDSLTYYVTDLRTMSICHNTLEVPADISPINRSGVRDVVNGLFVWFNGAKYNWELIDPLTNQIYFSHHVTQTHRDETITVHNKRQFVYIDAAEIFVFDTIERKLLWGKEFISATIQIDDKCFWRATLDPSKIEVFRLGNQDKPVTVDLNPESKIPSFCTDDEGFFIIAQSQPQLWDSCVFVRYGWDGSKIELPEVPSGNNNLRQPFFYDGKIHAWASSDNTCFLYRFEDGKWKTIYRVQSTKYMLCEFWSKYLAFSIDEKHIKIVNLEDWSEKVVDATNRGWFSFIGSFLVVNYPKAIVIETTDWQTLGTDAGEMVGYDEDAVYFKKDKKIITFKNGKKTEKEYADLKSFSYEVSVSKGFVLDGTLLFDLNGNKIQNFSYMHSWKLQTIDGQTCIISHLHSYIVCVYNLEQAISFSVKTSGDGMVIKNLGKTNLTGKFWLEPFEGLVCKKLGDAKTIDIAPGKSSTIDIGQLKDFLLVTETNGLLSVNDSDDIFDGKWHPCDYEGSVDTSEESFLNIRRITLMTPSK